MGRVAAEEAAGKCDHIRTGRTEVARCTGGGHHCSARAGLRPPVYSLYIKFYDMDKGTHLVVRILGHRVSN